jgi:hypothetical protein
MNRRLRALRCAVAERLAVVCLLLAVLALVPGAPALAASGAAAGASTAGGAVAPSPVTVATTVPTIATTTPTIATTTPATPAATVTTPAATAAPTTTSNVASQFPGQHVLGSQTLTKRSGSGKLSGGAILAAIIAGLIALACLLWGIFRIGAFEPHWLLSARHSVAEAGFRAAGTWDEFTDWLRLGH